MAREIKVTDSSFRFALAFTLAIAIPLTIGFLPAVTFAARWLDASSRTEAMLFPVAAAFFWVTFPRQGTETHGDRYLWYTLPLPFLIALVFGFFSEGGNLLQDGLPRSEEAWIALCWFAVLAPLGEEFLFRGWLYNVVESLWPQTLIPLTNPLPLSVWMTALAFSLWHLQDFGHGINGWVLFQTAYTFVLGIWLGYLRWKSGNLLKPFVAHCMINTAVNLL